MGEFSGDGTAVDGLGGAAGYGETALPRGDEGYAQVDLSAVFETGFVLDGVSYAADEVFISTDGFITFGTGVSVMPGDAASLPMPFIAPFMADIDTRLDGEGAESGQVWLDIDTVQDCVTITWEDVGFYRRNASVTNTLQLQLYDRGGGAMDVVFRYDTIAWTSGDIEGGNGGTGGSPARIGYRVSSSGAVTYIGPSGDEAGLLALPTSIGNTGVPGVFVYRVGGAPLPIIGSGGDDALLGTAGADTLQGMAGADALIGSDGADLMDGGDGIDSADYSGAGAAVGIDLVNPSANLGQAAGDQYLSIEAIVGSAHDDFIFGDALGTWADGGAGNDTLDGRGGADLLLGGQGDDILLGDAGADTLDGGAGNDLASGQSDNDLVQGGVGNDQLNGNHGNDTVQGGDDRDTVFGQNGNDRLEGGAGADTLTGHAGDDTLIGGEGNDLLTGSSGHDSLQGGGGNDTLDGDNGADFLAGNAGDDRLQGRAGDDSLQGGDGQDVLQGNPGADTLWGEASNDTLTGGSDGDWFVHSGSATDGTDLITDYVMAQGDVLALTQSGAVAEDFTLTYGHIGGGTAMDATVTQIATGLVLWILEDIGAASAVSVQSGSISFTLL